MSHRTPAANPSPRPGFDRIRSQNGETMIHGDQSNFIVAGLFATLGGVLLFITAVKITSWRLAIAGLFVAIVSILALMGMVALTSQGTPIGP